MTEEKSGYELNESIDLHFDDFLDIIKAMGNNSRLTILIRLLIGVKNFNDLKEETRLKKTALANHLNQLINVGLIQKPIHNRYKITTDGELFIRAFEIAYNRSERKKRILRENLQKRQFSETFIRSFFG